MKTAVLLGASFLAAAIGVARAEPVLSTEEGTTWVYEMREELGGPAAAAPTTVPISVSVGRQTFGGKEFLKFETRTDDVVTRTELMTLDDTGLVCHARAGKDGRMARLDPPQTVVPAALKTGDSWESDGEVAGVEMHQRFRVVGDEQIRVPAGNYHAFNIHC